MFNKTEKILKKSFKRKHDSGSEISKLSGKRRKMKNGTSIKIEISQCGILRETDWQAPRVVLKSSSVLRQYYADMKLMMKSANGTLYSAIEKMTGRPVCIKQVTKEQTKTFIKLENGSEMPSEFYFHFKAAQVSKTVVEPLAWLEFRKYYMIVMEKPVDSIDLFEVSKKYGALTEPAAMEILSQLLECAKALHRAGICHRDIKDENLLFNMKTFEIKLIDFGSATRVTESKYYSQKGTPEYFPPEFYLEDSYGAEELTIWSIGAVLYILLTAEWKFEKPYVKRNDIKEQKLSPGIVNILNGLLCPNPSQRFKFTSLVFTRP